MTDHPHLILKREGDMWSLEIEDVGPVFSMGTLADMKVVTEFILNSARHLLNKMPVLEDMEKQRLEIDDRITKEIAGTRF